MNRWALVEASLCLEELDALKQTAKLILPTATRGKELFENKRAAPYLLFIPCQSAEIIQRTKHGTCKDATCAKS